MPTIIKNKSSILSVVILATALLIAGFLISQTSEPVGAQASCVSPPSNIVSWWPLDETSGTIAADIIDGNSGALNGPVWTSAGKVNGALSFDGANDYVNVPHNVNLDPGTGPFTVDTWLKTTTSSGSQAVVAKYECGGSCPPSAASFYGFYTSEGKAQASLRDTAGTSQTLTGSTPVADGNFHHVAMVRDTAGGQLRLYVDGALDASAVLTVIGAIKDDDGEADPLTVGAVFVGGSSSKQAFFSGTIDEVEYFNRALSQAEIQAIVAAGSAGKCKPQPAVCGNSVKETGEDCDDGNTISDDGCSTICGNEICTQLPSGTVSWWKAEGNAQDTTDGNHGTLMNGATFAPGKVGQAFSFDGVNDYVDMGNPSNIQSTAVGTVAAWIKTTTGGVVLAAGKSNAASPFFMLTSWGFYTYDNVGWQQLSSYSVQHDGNWHFLTWVGDGSTLKFYIDGVQKPLSVDYGSNSGRWFNHFATDNVAIGVLNRNVDYGPFNGLIDEVQVFDRVLTLAEIQAEFAAGSAGTCKPQPAVCGNGVVEAGEGCDDGNTISGDGCSATCGVEVCSGIASDLSLTSWWPGEGNADDVVRDNEGTLQNGATFAPGMVGQTFSFDGVDDYVSVPDSDDWAFGTGDFAIDFWVKRLNSNEIRFLSQYQNNDNRWYISWHPAPTWNNQLALGVRSGGNWVVITAWPNVLQSTNTWYHVALVRRGGNTYELFVDGVSQGTQTSSGVFPNLVSPLYMGVDWWNGALNVKSNMALDELEIFSKALSASEIQSIYNAGSAGKCEAPITSPIVGIAVEDLQIISSGATFDGNGVIEISPDKQFHVAGNASYAGSNNTIFAVGASAGVTIRNANNVVVYSQSGSTDVNGNFLVGPFNSLPPGVYTAEVVVTDFTFTGVASITFKVKTVPGADLVGSFLASSSSILEQTDLTISVLIRNQGTDPVSVSTVARVFFDGVLLKEETVPPLVSLAGYSFSVAVPGQPAGTTHALSLTVDANNNAVESNESNNTASLTLKYHAGGPDLYPASYDVTPSNILVGDTVNLFVNVKNKGELASGATGLSAFVDGVAVGSAAVSALVPGANQLVTLTLPPAPYGVHTISFTIDPGNLVSERDESNNSASLQKKWHDPLPDLVGEITNVQTAVGVQQATFNITVKNVEGGAAGPFDVQLFVDGALVNTKSIAGLSGFGSNTSYQVALPAAFGSHTAKIIVDPNNSVTEFSETNNTHTKNFIVADVVPAGSNLEVTSGSIALFVGGAETTTIVPGGSGIIKVTIKNIGDAEAVNAVITLKVNNEVVGNSSPFNLLAGASQTVSFNWTAPAMEGGVIAEASVTANSDVDNGNNAASRAFIVAVAPTDTIAPVSFITTTPANPNANNWFSSDVSFQVTATDNGGSGVQAVYACVDQTNTCNPLTGLSGATSVSGVVVAEGTNYVRFQAKDNAGNIETTKVKIINLDKSLPSSTLASLLAFDGDGLVNLAWNSSDAVSGVAQVELYRGTTLIHTSGNTSGSFVDNLSAVINDGQSFNYYARARDFADWTSNSLTRSTTIDLSPPSVPVVLPLPAYTSTPPVLLKWKRAVDVTAGVDFYSVYRDGANYATVDEADPNGTDITQERSYADSAVANGQTLTYAVSATDLAVPSHESVKSDSTATTIDMAGPITALSLSPAVPNGQNGWFVTPVGVTLTCNDVVSGCAETKYSIDGGLFATYTGPFLMNSDGTHLLKYYSIDNANNVEAEKSQSVKFDQTKPVISNNSVPAATNNPSLTLTGTVTDAMSGVASFTISGQPVTLGVNGSYSYTVTLSEGANTITEIAKDVAGNQQTVTKQITLDSIAPAITCPASQTVSGSPFAANGMVSDAGSGVASVVVDSTAANIVGTDWSASLPLSQGANPFTAVATDSVGNSASCSFVITQVPDSDGDGVNDASDNCPLGANPDQLNSDIQNGGDVCDICPADATDTCNVNKAVGKFIDSGGGVVTTPDGSAAINIPAGALPTGSSISITPSPPADANVLIGAPAAGKGVQVSGTQFRFEPSGLIFYQPVTITLTYSDAGMNPRQESKFAIYVFNPVTGKYDKQLTTCDTALNVCTATITHFTLFAVVAPRDSDNDGVFDDFEGEVDACPTVAGLVDRQGCNVADKNIVTLHTVNLGGGASTKAPLPGASVRVFDRNKPDFQAIAGSKNPDGSLYGVIYEADAGRVGACATASDGTCIVGEATTGDYLVIVKYADTATNKTVYVGRPKSPSDFVDTNADTLPDLATKDFQIIKTFKNGVFQGYRGGSKIVVTGSILEMIVPESAVWEGTSSIYPFVFTSDSDWTVDVCAQVPIGYSIIGVYDENGNLLGTTECVQTIVANTTKIVAFEVREIGSPEPSLSVTVKTKNPKGKVTSFTHKASDLREGTFNSEVSEAKKKRMF